MHYLTKQLAQEIVVRTMAIIGRNINVMNEQGIIIGSGDNSRLDDIHQGAVRVIEQQAELEVTEKDAGLLHGVKPGINLPITYQGEIIGVIGITGPPNEIKSFAELVKMAAEMIVQQSVFIQQMQWDDRLKEELVSQLVHSEGKLDRLFYERAERIGINHSIKRVAVALRTDNRPQVLNYLKNKLGKNDLYLMQPDHIILLIANQGQSPHLKDIIKTAESWVQLLKGDTNHGCQIGIGGSLEPDSIRESYIQAKAALEAGRKLHPDKSIYHYEDYLLPVILHETGKSNSWDRLKNYSLQLNNDDKGELLETLKVYLDENGDMNKVAQRLFIHRNTLRYRLEKIREITGLDPRKIKDLTTLYLSLLATKLT
ncbi:CdaR family transcriptional regulator [Mesobacillus harenae]|uniref:CdaR family transcriptional regulator n=1 Tax=Mesobacillus harenae TaxID=2213203 RepID=UPI001580C083|nr:sugar diacid recognition domain-containing protein [Mesobacillus harenae]